MSATERRVATLLAAVYAIRMVGLFMLLPLLALFAAEREHATSLLIGLAIGSYGLTQALLQIPFGIASDRFGRKPLIILGLLLFASGSLVAAWSSSIEMLIVGRALQGAGAIAAVIMALMSDLIADEHRTKAMALIGTTIGIAFIVAMVAGPLLSRFIGIAGLFHLTALLAAVGMVIVWWAVPTPPRQRFHHDTEVEPARLWQIMSDRELFRLNSGAFVLHFVLTATFVTLPLRLVSGGLAGSDHWQLYGIILPLAMAVTIPFIIMAEKRRRLRGSFIAAIAVILLSQIGLGVVDNQLVLLGGLLGLFFAAFNLLEATLPSLVSKFTPPASKGSAMGVFASSQFFGAFCGGLIGGLLHHHFADHGLFWATTLPLLLWLLLARGMAEPPYISSLILHVGPLSVAKADLLRQQLLELEGVVEAEVDGSDESAYLKIDRKQIDEAALERKVFEFTP
ncbi:MFS transporter [Ectothiorhodospiraceae bacterium BW-2]|nr:MFS transporter [Ectothiorhodospiraceae bacterium BW-2]